MAADQIQIPWGVTGETIVARLWNSDSEIWHLIGPVGFQTYAVLSLVFYATDISGTEIGTASGIYTYTIPPTAPAGRFRVEAILGDGTAEGQPIIWSEYVDWDGSAIVELSGINSRLPTQITKNTALAAFPFLMVLASDDITPATGLTVTATRSLDGAAFGACANAVAEVGSGIYTIDLAAADLNGDTVTLRFTAATANDRLITIVTQP